MTVFHVVTSRAASTNEKNDIIRPFAMVSVNVIDFLKGNYVF